MLYNVLSLHLSTILYVIHTYLKIKCSVSKNLHELTLTMVNTNEAKMQFHSSNNMLEDSNFRIKILKG